MVNNQEKIAAAEARELELHKEIIKVASTSDRIISAVQSDRAGASALREEIVSLAKAASYVTSAADEAQLRNMLESQTGTAKVACQILREITAAQKSAAVKETTPAGFVLASGGNGRAVASQAGGSDEEDFIGKYAASLR